MSKNNLSGNNLYWNIDFKSFNSDTKMDNRSRDLLYYLTYNPSDEKWGTILTTVGYQFIPNGSPYPLSKHPDDYSFVKQKGRILNEYQFVYITKGKGYFESSHVKLQEVKPGDLFLLFPGEWHNYYPDAEIGWDEYWVGFKGRYFEQLQAEHFFSCKMPLLHIGVSNSMIGLYEDLIRTANNEKSGHQVMLAGILQHLTSTIYYKHKNQTFGDSYVIEVLDKARKLMKEQIEEQISAEMIAGQIGVGYSWFRRMFKNYTGISPAQYQIQLRLIRAKELLARTSLAISDIAYQLHFENAGQFATFFRKREGVTPTAYRNRQKSE